MIQPTVGRVIWYQPAHEVGGDLQPQPFAGIITFVHDDRMINICAFTPAGTPFAVQDLALLQDDDAAPEEGRFASWMPYQIGQAAAAAATTI